MDADALDVEENAMEIEEPLATREEIQVVE
jgi:hypothetical protein